MLNTLKQPCAQCPFKKDSVPGWLGGETVADTYHHVMEEGDFTCHMQRHKPKANQSRCKGSLQFLRQAGKSPKYNTDLKIAVSRETLPVKNILNIQQFFTHHTIK